MRCFIALDMDEKIRQFCENKTNELKQSGFRAKWVESENLHLTLFFLGEIDRRGVSVLREIVEKSNPSDFSLIFNRVGYFRKQRQPTTIWLGIEKSDGLNALYKKMKTEIEHRTQILFKETFRPHLTLGRVKDAPENWSDILEEQCPVALRLQKIHIQLYSSTLTKNGPIYRPLL
ncbi:MAG TPA: RNA 2',3'-cyclic phosphodiesterase [Thermotogota bacterium]|mgnify:CR=1 FL=1|nr:RNA 2',3'-cyclic phosphodiesterase [Thermotogota bacterium]HPJ88101.1 RNA 2',3'-cyclic phosphodiesterase [Thermotogota bacterium]HPR96039.1 RNA 2',3'-cyclic phosphodiesterase [Thermotogota bacterium]